MLENILPEIEIEEQVRRNISFQPCIHCGSDKINFSDDGHNEGNLGGGECADCGFDVRNTCSLLPGKRELIQIWNVANNRLALIAAEGVNVMRAMYARKAVEFGRHVEIGSDLKNVTQYMWSLPFKVAIVPRFFLQDECANIFNAIKNNTYNLCTSEIDGCTLLGMLGKQPKRAYRTDWIDAQLGFWTPENENTTHLIKPSYHVKDVAYNAFASERVIIVPVHDWR
jgi:hypothetical protein